LKYKHITPYFIPVINTTLDVCEFLNGTQSNLATRWFFNQSLASFSKDFIHPCPHEGLVAVYNVSGDPKMVQISKFFAGTYLAIIRMFDELDDNIITMFHESLLTTVPDKNVAEKRI
jgi:Protein of unknown function (DUF1091)